MKRLDQTGFGHVATVFVFVAVLAAVGLIGFKIRNLNKPTTANAPAVVSTKPAAVPKVVQAKIDAQSQLKTVDQSLGDINAQLDSSFDTSSLDSAIQTLY